MNEEILPVCRTAAAWEHHFSHFLIQKTTLHFLWSWRALQHVSEKMEISLYRKHLCRAVSGPLDSEFKCVTGEQVDDNLQPLWRVARVLCSGAALLPHVPMKLQWAMMQRHSRMTVTLCSCWALLVAAAVQAELLSAEPLNLHVVKQHHQHFQMKPLHCIGKPGWVMGAFVCTAG